MKSNNNNNKAKQRWKILRNAIITNNNKNNNNNNTINPASIHAFPGFSLLSKKIIKHNYNEISKELSDYTDTKKDKNRLLNSYLRNLCDIPIEIKQSSLLSNDDDDDDDNNGYSAIINEIKREISKCIDCIRCLLPGDDDVPKDINSDNATTRIRVILYKCSDKIGIEEDSNNNNSVYNWKDILQNTIITELEKEYNVKYNKMHQNDLDDDLHAMMIQQYQEEEQQIEILLDISISMPFHNNSNNNNDYNCYEYTIYYNKNIIKVRTRERNNNNSNNNKLSIKELSSEIYNDGIDNTGNICLWDCSIILTYLLFKHESKINFDLLYSSILQKQNAKTPSLSSFNIIELGAGMAALPSFALYNIQKNTPLHVTITDGHDNSIMNNKINYHLSTTTSLTKLEKNKTNKINYSKLKWDKSNGKITCQSLIRDDNGNDNKYHLCLVSDCLHFINYHVDLLYTINRLLDVNGICILCQPKRGTSMKLFLDLVYSFSNDTTNTAPLYDVTVLEDGYDDRIMTLHETYLKEYESYCPNVHYPIIIILKKLREWVE